MTQLAKNRADDLDVRRLVVHDEDSRRLNFMEQCRNNRSVVLLRWRDRLCV
jgi:hypothetical protein